MAIFLESQNKLDEALPQYERALKGYEASLGAGHAHTLLVMNNLGSLLSKQSKPESRR